MFQHSHVEQYAADRIGDRLAAARAYRAVRVARLARRVRPTPAEDCAGGRPTRAGARPSARPGIQSVHVPAWAS